MSRKSRTRVETNISFAMIRRLVNGSDHDLHPLQFHMFLSEADLPQFLLHHLLKKPRRILPQRNVNVFGS